MKNLLTLSIIFLFTGCLFAQQQKSETELIPDENRKYRYDTIITFDSDTYEEKIKIIRTEVDENGKDVSLSNKEPKITSPELTKKYRVDKVMTFDPDTYEQSVKVIRVEIDENGNDIIQENTKNIQPLNFPKGSQEAKDNFLILKYINQRGLTNVQRTESGIYYIIEQAGTGPEIEFTDQIAVHYNGELLNGDIFDSSYFRKEPLEFTLDRVIEGWQICIPLLKKGGKGKFIIPSNLAYGDMSRGRIPANSVLVMDIEIISIK